MAALCALAISKLLYPETEEFADQSDEDIMASSWYVYVTS
jgi:hypothetical protein